ncbi:MAG: TIGR02710 family CRISPR-associated CARF protein [Bryobacteraceae bacterium]
MPDPCSVLLLTVGTGTRDRPVETILEPFRKSLEAARAERNILLPSRETVAVARMIQDRLPQFHMEIHPLPAAGDENNADRCFAHYDAVLAGLISAGADPHTIIADITRGTKAMSAALLMAAAARGVRRVRYLVGEQRDPSGMAVAGTENVSDIEPAFIFLRQTLSRAQDLLRAGDFRAVERLLAPLLPGQSRPRDNFQKEAAVLHWAARFWGAWDRFDYAQARRLLPEAPSEDEAPVSPWIPALEQKNLLARLAAPLPLAMGERVKHCRALAADLLANAERRLEEGRHEEVLVRVYRIVELMTTYRLYSHGIDAEDVDYSDSRVQDWLRSSANVRTPGPHPSRALGRKNATELLLFLEKKKHPTSRGVGVAEKLADTRSWLGQNDAGLRNASILIHGLSSTAAGIAEKMPDILGKLRDFFYEEHEKNRDLHLAARFPFLVLRDAVRGA